MSLKRLKSCLTGSNTGGATSSKHDGKDIFAMKIWEAAAAAYTLMFKPAGSIEPMGVKILPPPQIMHQGHHDRDYLHQNLDRHKEALRISMPP